MKNKGKNVCVDNSLEIAAGMVSVNILKAMCAANKTVQYIVRRVIETACNDTKLRTFLMQMIIYPN